jgi:hypothetical protein
MWLTKNPEDYGVIVASNLFGDVISDAFAGLVGGLGFAASGNIGREVAVFEPTHGSAPKYAELDPPIVNPIAMILSAAMLLDHVGEREKAERVRKAIADAVREGTVRTYDMLRIPGGAKLFQQFSAQSLLEALSVFQAAAGGYPERFLVLKVRKVELEQEHFVFRVDEHRPAAFSFDQFYNPDLWLQAPYLVARKYTSARSIVMMIPIFLVISKNSAYDAVIFGLERWIIEGHYGYS